MSFQDKVIRCSLCGAGFTFSAEKQELFKSWGISYEPKQCPSCQKAMKSKQCSSTGYSGNSSGRTFKAICADCGKTTNLPFEPRGGKRVYCSDCYRKVRQFR